MHAASDQASDVGHIKNVDCAYLVGDLAHPGEIPKAGIGAGAADDHFGLFACGDFFHFVVVDQLGVTTNVVEGGPIELAAEAEFVSVGEMAAVGQIEAQNGVARLQNRRKGGGVGLRAGVGLDVGVLGAEE